MTSSPLTEFATRYAKAWCSQNPESVAAFFAENASLTVNGGPPTPPLQIARGFMRDFPDMIVTFDKLEPRGDQTAVPLDTNRNQHGPSGTGNKFGSAATSCGRLTRRPHRGIERPLRRRGVRSPAEIVGRPHRLPFLASASGALALQLPIATQ